MGGFCSDWYSCIDSYTTVYTYWHTHVQGHTQCHVNDTWNACMSGCYMCTQGIHSVLTFVYITHMYMHVRSPPQHTIQHNPSLHYYMYQVQTHAYNGQLLVHPKQHVMQCYNYNTLQVHCIVCTNVLHNV